MLKLSDSSPSYQRKDGVFLLKNDKEDDNSVLKTFWEDFTLEEDVWISFKKFKYLIKNDVSVHSYLQEQKQEDGHE